MGAAGCLDCSIALCRPHLQRGRVHVEIRRLDNPPTSSNDPRGVIYPILWQCCRRKGSSA